VTISYDATSSYDNCAFTLNKQLTDLQTAVTGVGSGTSLADKVTQIRGYVAANDNSHGCSSLGAFMNQVQAQMGKNLTTAQAASLLNQARDIKTTLNC
jgi:hypothetical protein